MRVLPDFMERVEQDRGRDHVSGLEVLLRELGMPPYHTWELDEDGFYYYDREAATASQVHWRNEL